MTPSRRHHITIKTWVNVTWFLLPWPMPCMFAQEERSKFNPTRSKSSPIIPHLLWTRHQRTLLKLLHILHHHESGVGMSHSTLPPKQKLSRQNIPRGKTFRTRLSFSCSLGFYSLGLGCCQVERRICCISRPSTAVVKLTESTEGTSSILWTQCQWERSNAYASADPETFPQSMRTMLSEALILHDSKQQLICSHVCSGHTGKYTQRTFVSPYCIA